MKRNFTDEQIEEAVRRAVDKGNTEDPTRPGRLEKFPPKLSHEDHYKGWVLGFLFSEDLEHVVLLQKTHPDWQSGRLNGIGGKIEPGESHRAAIWREGKEETGYDYDDWQYLRPFTSSKPGLHIHVFYGVGDVDKVKTMTDEQIVICKVQSLKDGWYPEKMLIGGTTDLVQECISKLENIHAGTPSIK
jgi:hypothetical protein